MIKHYGIHTGIERTHRILYFGLTLLLAIGTVFALYSTHNTANRAATHGGPAEALTQAIQTPASAVRTELNAPMPWPSYGHSAFIIPGENLAAISDPSTQETQPVPIASLAKVITALAIMQKSPIQEGEQGPTYSFSAHDVAIYELYVQKNGAVLPVEVGTQISQRQSLDGMLMVSANNITDSQVLRTFGSMESYIEYANTMLRELGFSKTTVADASGFSPQTVSTAEEMAQIGHLYMKNPVLRSIALQKTAQVPVTGEIRNFNALVKQDGIIGIKIGNTDEAGRCFMAADLQAGTGETASIAVVLGAENLRTAADDAEAILRAGQKARSQN